MKHLLEIRERLAAEIADRNRVTEVLVGKLAGVDISIATMRGAGAGTEPPRPKRNVKRTVLEVVQDAGKAGVTVLEVLEKAQAKGKALERGSVSSLLSRFKREGVLHFDGERYYPMGMQPEPPNLLKVIK